MAQVEAENVDPSEHFGDWQILDTEQGPITSGNALVYQVVSDQHPDQHALKVLRGDFDSEPKTERRRERILREIALCELAEQNGIERVVRVVDKGEIEGRPWYVMRWADRGALSLGMEPPAAVKVVTEVAKSLSALKAIGIAHRDIKPSNILIFGSDFVLADLGLALDEVDGSDLTGSNEHVGSAGYRAPEAIGHIDYDPFAADVYSLGKTLWALIAGVRPDQAALDESTSLSARGRTVPDNGVLDSLLIRYTQRDASKRPSIEGVITDLEAWSRDPSLPASSVEDANRRLHSVFAKESDENARTNERNSAVDVIRGRLRNSIGNHFISTFEGLGFSLRVGNWGPPEGWVASIGSEFPVSEGWQHTACWVATGDLLGETANIYLAVAARHGVAGDGLQVQLHWLLKHSGAEETFEMMGSTGVEGRIYEPALGACVEDIIGWVEDPERVNELTVGLQRVRSRASKQLPSKDVSIRVLDPAEGVAVEAVLKSGLLVDIELDASGSHSGHIEGGQLSRLWVSHPDHLGVVVLPGELPAELALQSAGRSLRIGRTGSIPGLGGRIAPALDNQDRMYAHLTDLTVEGSADNPYTFELGVPFSLRGANGVLVEVTVKDLTRQHALINYRPHGTGN